MQFINYNIKINLCQLQILQKLKIYIFLNFVFLFRYNYRLQRDATCEIVAISFKNLISKNDASEQNTKPLDELCEFPQIFHRTVLWNVPWTVLRISSGFLADRFDLKEYKRFCLYQKMLSVIRIFRNVIGKVPIFACKLERVSG